MMKYRLLVILLLVWAYHGIGQSQSQINEDAQKKFLRAENQLNDVYKAVLKTYKTDTAFLKNFRIAQRLWLKLRDAELCARYPDRQPGYYGTVQPMCRAMYKEELTKERTEKIRVWLTGIEEGDVCGGSVKTK